MIGISIKDVKHEGDFFFLCLTCAQSVKEAGVALHKEDRQPYPIHCDFCGALIPFELSDEGMNYTEDRVKDNTFKPEVLDVWRRRYFPAA